MNLRIALGIAMCAGAISCSKQASAPKSQEQIVEENAKKILPHVVELQRREKKVDETIWAKEMVAERCGLAIDKLWDTINYSTNKLGVVAQFPIGEASLPQLADAVTLPHDVQTRAPAGSGRKLSRGDWQALVQQIAADGWQLGKLEFRHTRFDPAALTSEFYFCAELANPARQELATLEGTLGISWEALPPGEEPPAVRAFDASKISLRSRRGAVPFELVINENFEPKTGSPFIDPLIVYDLDGDGRPEIILAAINRVLRVNDWKIVDSSPLCAVEPGIVHTALIADINNDGIPDFLCAKKDGLFLYEASAPGKFDKEPRLVWAASDQLRYALCMTAGDIDGDGDLDIWLTQYKVPYLRGQLPTPYYEANDSYPAYLLRNDGHGNFSDITAESGLAPKRNRRTYSASFADLDGDGHLDLAVVSDFSGLDLYRNDGKGNFTDVTSKWAGEPYATGMAHAFADFNRDGRLDLLMMGMTSPTVDRLEAMNLHRPDVRTDDSKRAQVMFGNRLLVAKANGGFEHTPLSESIRRSGWAWGCAAADFDNDGFPDVYVANGHETKDSVRDYEGAYWLHNIYIGTSAEDAVNITYFAMSETKTRGRGYSFGGWDRNRFYWNKNGGTFVELGHLFGVSLPEDSRNVVAADMDADGRPDLLVTTFEAWPHPRLSLRVFRNNIDSLGNWIGVRVSQTGATVTIDTEAGRISQPLVTGDSFRSQSPNTIHFGLGQAKKVQKLEVRLPNGNKTELRDPEINRYHAVDLK